MGGWEGGERSRDLERRGNRCDREERGRGRERKGDVPVAHKSTRVLVGWKHQLCP